MLVPVYGFLCLIYRSQGVFLCMETPLQRACRNFNVRRGFVTVRRNVVINAHLLITFTFVHYDPHTLLGLRIISSILSLFHYFFIIFIK